MKKSRYSDSQILAILKQAEMFQFRVVGYWRGGQPDGVQPTGLMQDFREG